MIDSFVYFISSTYLYPLCNYLPTLSYSDLPTCYPHFLLISYSTSDLISISISLWHGVVWWYAMPSCERPPLYPTDRYFLIPGELPVSFSSVFGVTGYENLRVIMNDWYDML